MALGGGTFVTQNKVLPGSYINIVSAVTSVSALGNRGTVAIALPIGKEKGSIIEITAEEFAKDANTILGFANTDDKAKPLRELFLHASKVIIYDTGDGDGVTVANICTALEPYEFHVIAAYTDTAADKTTYINTTKTWVDGGKQCQAVVYNPTAGPDSEVIINVTTTVSDENADPHALVAWVAGAEAGCGLNESCTNKIYDGEYTVAATLTQAQLETALTTGKFVLHRVYGDIRVLEDINSLVTTTDTKSADFKYNQTMRVVQQSANDLAKLFNINYIGKIPNDQAGRDAFWADVVAYNRELESIRAIENFDSGTVTVERGATKKSVVASYSIQPVNAMSQLYMTVVVM